MSLQGKLILGLLVVLLAGAYGGYRWLDDHIRPQYLGIMEDAMVDHAYILARQVEDMLPDQNPETSMNRLSLVSILDRVRLSSIEAPIYGWKKTKINTRIYLMDAQGIVRYDSDRGHSEGQNFRRWRDVHRALQGQYGARSSRGVDSYGRPYRALFVTFPLYKKSKRIGVLSLAKSKDSLTGWALQARSRLWYSLLLWFGLLLLLTWLLIQFWMRPVFRLTQYARDVTEGRRVVPPPITNDEVGTLTREFLAMKSALWKRQDIEQYVTQLTHELKSPISAIQGAAELLEDPDMPTSTRHRFLGNIQEQSRRMDDIVQRLLGLLALEQQEQLENPTSIDIEPLLQALVDRFLPQAQQHSIALSIQKESTAFPKLWGDRFLLEQALANLLQNSFHFTYHGGEIALGVRKESKWLADGTAYEMVVLDVTDTGTGIPDYALDRVMDKFYSLEHPDTGKKGTGLGLPFVKQVALLHGGDFVIGNGKERGVSAQLWIPVTPRG